MDHAQEAHGGALINQTLSRSKREEQALAPFQQRVFPVELLAYDAGWSQQELFSNSQIFCLSLDCLLHQQGQHELTIFFCRCADFSWRCAANIFTEAPPLILGTWN